MGAVPPHLAERFAATELHRLLGLELLEARPGYARIALRTGPATLSGVGGAVHGGVLAAMVDIAMLFALQASLQPGDVPNGTADLGITYLRPVHGPRAEAEAHIIRKGRSLAYAEVAITDAQGSLCARGRTLYALRQAPPPG
ncbi:PaaI family thioesterase [Tepidiforma flava]|uniref:PaaI family thioesterase n=1 Tax=Tepidiforma flava TaxID=3004094 RepID=A0ABY7M930_9CHLR|nr:PaaI family thioesterase [Tepidiforma flava]WBL36930.1 PaaI family thioesterase [Tepidiforma flava]